MGSIYLLGLIIIQLIYMIIMQGQLTEIQLISESFCNYLEKIGKLTLEVEDIKKELKKIDEIKTSLDELRKMFELENIDKLKEIEQKNKEDKDWVNKLFPKK